MALLPGFVAADASLGPQFAIMLMIMLSTEFISMTAYATGGQWLALSGSAAIQVYFVSTK